MFGLENISKYFKRASTESIAPVIEERLEDDWLVLGTTPSEDDTLIVSKKDHHLELESDFVSVSETDCREEYDAQQKGRANEQNAKRYAYGLAVPLTTNPDKALATEKLLEQEGYTLVKLGSDAGRSKGIFLYALINKNNQESPITVVCRGTQLDASIIADLDPSGPGRAIMEQERETILGQINELSNDYPGKKLRVTGHSLGGTVAQTLTAFILNEKRKNLEGTSQYEALGTLSGVDTIIYQSAGVSPELAQQAKEDAQLIKSMDEHFKMCLVAHVKKGDFVSQTGTYMFSDIDNETVDVSLSLRDLDKPCLTLGDYLDIGFSAATTGPIGALTSLIKNGTKTYFNNRFQAHRDFFYHDKDQELLPETYGMYRNDSPQDRDVIKKVFEKNILPSIPGSATIQSTLFNLLDGLTSDELQGMAACTGGVATLVNAAVTTSMVATTNPVKAAAILAKHATPVSKAVKAIEEGCEAARSGFSRLCFWSSAKSTPQEHNAPQHSSYTIY